MFRFLLVVTVCASTALANYRDDHSRLYNHVISNNTVLGKYSRPVLEDATTMIVEIELSLAGVQSVDEKTGVMISSGWVGYSWMNQYMTWDPADFGGIEEMRLPSSELWVPDIYLFNDATGQYNAKVLENQLSVLVTSDGSTHWTTPSQFKTMCDFSAPISGTFNCSLIFGSWTYNEELIDLQPVRESADLGNFNGNTKWELTQAPAERHSKVYECCPNPYIDVTYTLNIARRVQNENKKDESEDSDETVEDEEDEEYMKALEYEE